MYTRKMKPFLTIDETTTDPTAVPATNRDSYYKREAARAVVIDDNGSVALLHVTSGHYYKLPGGGIDEGENPAQALERELQEEIGCKAEVVTDIGIIQEHRAYMEMSQISYCYLAKQIGEKGMPDFTQKELSEGFEIVWAGNIDEAIMLLESSAKTAPDVINTTFMRLRDSAIAKKAKLLLEK